MDSISDPSLAKKEGSIFESEKKRSSVPDAFGKTGGT